MGSRIATGLSRRPQGSQGMCWKRQEKETLDPLPGLMSQPGDHASHFGFCISQKVRNSFVLHNSFLPWPFLLIFLRGAQVWNTCPTIPSGKPGCLIPSVLFLGALPKCGTSSSPSPWDGKGLPFPVQPPLEEQENPGAGQGEGTAFWMWSLSSGQTGLCRESIQRGKSEYPEAPEYAGDAQGLQQEQPRS